MPSHATNATFFIIPMCSSFHKSMHVCLAFSAFNYLIDPCRHRVKNVPSLQFI